MPNGNRPPKRHHYVPQGYLRNFTTPEGWLYGYNKRTGQAFQGATPQNVAAEDYFHTDPRREDPQELERVLDRNFEAPLLRTINAVIAHVRFARTGIFKATPQHSPEEKYELAIFAALQLLRTNKTRSEMAVVSSRQRTNGMTLTDQELARYAHLELLADHLRDDFQWFASTIARNRLTFLVPPPGFSFWTSDHPVLVGRGTIDGRAFRGGVGLSNQHLELYLPLAWDVTAVFVGNHLDSVPDLVHMTSEAVNKHNQVTFQEADRLVLGRSAISPASLG
jgi:Protein of unknown function (DUF4238)